MQIVMTKYKIDRQRIIGKSFKTTSMYKNTEKYKKST